MCRLLLTCVVFFLALCAAPAGAGAADEAAARFRFTEQPGPLPVGLRVVNQYDYSRTFRPPVDAFGKPYKGERARPLQTLVWYPSVRTSGSPMRVRDYGDLLAAEISFDKPRLSPEWQEWLAGITPTLEDPLWAVRDAPSALGRFPVVVYAPSFGSMSWGNADLCEYLALVAPQRPPVLGLTSAPSVGRDQLDAVLGREFGFEIVRLTDFIPISRAGSSSRKLPPSTPSTRRHWSHGQFLILQVPAAAHRLLRSTQSDFRVPPK